MSATFAAAAQALNNDPDLMGKITSAGSAEERAAHFRAAGVEVPSHADVNSHMANMSGVAGGANTQTDTNYGTDAAAAGAAAA